MNTALVYVLPRSTQILLKMLSLALFHPSLKEVLPWKDFLFYIIIWCGNSLFTTFLLTPLRLRTKPHATDTMTLGGGIYFPQAMTSRVFITFKRQLYSRDQCLHLSLWSMIRSLLTADCTQSFITMPNSAFIVQKSGLKHRHFISFQPS